MRRRPRREPEALGGAIPGVLADLGLHGAADALRVAACWSEAVGEEAARHAEPSLLRGSVLEVTADSSSWAQQLQLQHDRILERLRGALGEAAPTALRIRVG